MRKRVVLMRKQKSTQKSIIFGEGKIEIKNVLVEEIAGIEKEERRKLVIVSSKAKHLWKKGENVTFR